MVDSVVLKGGTQPLWKLYDPPNLPDTWKLNTTWLGLASNVGSTQQFSIIERSLSVTKVYKLDQNYNPQMVGRAENVPFTSAADDRILFGNILDNIGFNDMIHLNSSGMFLYARENTKYRPLSQNYQLATFGWGKKHWNSANLIDVDRDGRDELWLTGPHGIVGFKPSVAGFECLSSGSEYNEEDRWYMHRWVNKLTHRYYLSR
uniref:ASPIC/UnbV domain-containing protein n=1 Tax=Anopheles maculatus TaxID=74869 RepID=A0A182SDV0_9DIPT